MIIKRRKSKLLYARHVEYDNTMLLFVDNLCFFHEKKVKNKHVYLKVA